MHEYFGDETVDSFLVDFPYTFKSKNITVGQMGLTVNIDRFFELALHIPNGSNTLTVSQPHLQVYLLHNHLDCFSHEWICSANGSGSVHVKHQPPKQESVLTFAKLQLHIIKAEKYMTCFN